MKLTDMTGNELELNLPARRIVSVVPSQTELLYDLGLHEEVAGITKFCVHPESWFKTKTRVGGTKQLKIEQIKSLHPDLILANKEENEKEQIIALAKEFPVWVSDIKTVADALKMIKEVGALTKREQQANAIASKIETSFLSFQKTSPKRVAYFIWYEPWMCAGGDTFINSMIESIGWKNVFDQQQRYPLIELSVLEENKPELVLLSSEPFPFKEKHVRMIKEVLPAADVKLVDGEMFSWYGSRMLKAVSYFRTLTTE